MRSILFDEEKIVHQTGGSPNHLDGRGEFSPAQLLDTGGGIVGEVGFFWGKDGNSASVEDLQSVGTELDTNAVGIGAHPTAAESLLERGKAALRGDIRAATKLLGPVSKAIPSPGQVEIISGSGMPATGVEVGIGPSLGLNVEAQHTQVLSTEDYR
jgi:hypothetical protein